MSDPAKHNSQNFLYQNKPEKEQYLPNPPPNNQFVTNVKSDNKDNNIIAMIKELFLNIRHKLSYKRLIEKVVHETCEFFIHSVRYMSFKDQIALYKIKLELKLFKALKIFSIL